ncbi:hypothetical protein McpSp1_13750 [Methanocorpusculaceae archaeon Sp1]|nr:hypothetical protein [Methanocorpusculaceae archaeon Sp1]
MLSYRIKRILFGIFILGIFWISIEVAQYTAAAESTLSLISLLYPVGLVLGFSTMLGAVLLDPRKPKDIDLLPLTRTSLGIMGVVGIAIMAVAGFLYYYLIVYSPEKVMVSTYAHSIGFLIGFIAVLIVYYLPEHLPHDEQQES